MMKLRSILAGLALALFWVVPALAQGAGQLSSGHMLANPTAASARPRDTSASAYLDFVFGSTRGSLLERGASGWTRITPSSSLFPLVSNGTGADPAFQQLTGAALPTPGSSSLGGVQSLTCSTHNWFNTLSTGGVFGCSQPSFADLSGSIASTQLPPPGASTLGAINSKDCSSGGQFVQKINTDGSITCNTPAGGGNVSGSGSSVAGDLPSINNTTTTALVSAGYNASQVPGLVPSSATVTISIASPAVITWTSHGLTANAPVYFCTSSGGALPTGLSSCVFPTAGSQAQNTYMTNPTVYYVVGSSITTNTFEVATSIANAKAGIAVNTSGSQSGTQTAFANAMSCTGCIGEQIWNINPAVSTTTNVGTTSPVACNNSSPDTVFNTITLQPGIWELWGSAGMFGTSTAVFSTSHASMGIGITSISSTPYNGTTDWHLTTNNSNGVLFPFNRQIITVLAANTVVNAVAEPVWTGSGATATCFGELHAMRIH